MSTIETGTHSGSIKAMLWIGTIFHFPLYLPVPAFPVLLLWSFVRLPSSFRWSQTWKSDFPVRFGGESVCLSFTQVNIQSCQLFGEGANQYQFFKQSFSMEILHQKTKRYEWIQLLCECSENIVMYASWGAVLAPPPQKVWTSKFHVFAEWGCNFGMFVFFIESQIGKWKCGFVLQLIGRLVWLSCGW